MSAQNRLQAGLTWPVFVEFTQIDGAPVVVALHNVIRVSPDKRGADGCVIKTRGTEHPFVTVVGSLDEFKARLRDAASAQMQAMSQMIARDLLAVLK